jgi:acyl-CoA thioesterase-2
MVRSFTTRSVKALQDGEAIFNCSISFQKREKGLEHQIDMPDVPEPETLKSELEIEQKPLKELNMNKRYAYVHKAKRNRNEAS